MATKKLSLVLFLMITIGTAFGQVPQTISYQGLLTDTDGNAARDGNYELTFVLYDAESGGRELWKEAQSVAVINGVFNVILGSDVPFELPFETPYWLGIQVGTEEELRPLIELTAAPYSLLAHSVSDSAITAEKLARGAAVRSINSLTEDVRLAAGDNVRITQENATLMISAEAGGGGSVWEAAGSNVYYDQGRVGVGTASPDAPLHVKDGDAEVKLGTSFSGVKARLTFNDPSNDDTYIEKLDQGRMRFRTGGNTTRMTITADGDVGIGTQNPSERLEVNGNIEVADKVTRSASGSTNMIPVSYGYLDAGGGVIMGSGNFSAERTATGVYEITVDDESLDSSTHFVMTQPRASFNVSWIMEDGKLEIRTSDSFFAPQNAAVNFIIFKP